MWKNARQQSWDEKPEVQQVRAIQSELRAAIKRNGPGFLASAEGQELREEVEQAIREIRRTPDFVEHTNRMFTLSAPRPKNVKADICRSVASEFSAKWGVELTPRLVWSCWDEFRALEKETRPAD